MLSISLTLVGAGEAAEDCTAYSQYCSAALYINVLLCSVSMKLCCGLGTL